MRCLLDTGVLLRLANRAMADSSLAWSAVRLLEDREYDFCVGSQNLIEFWNVCTRPATSRGGLGLSIAQATERLDGIEEVADILDDSPATYRIWRDLVISHRVCGRSVHDAKIVALMRAHEVNHILTFDPGGFGRYGVKVMTPSALLKEGR